MHQDFTTVLSIAKSTSPMVRPLRIEITLPLPTFLAKLLSSELTLTRHIFPPPLSLTQLTSPLYIPKEGCTPLTKAPLLIKTVPLRCII